MAKSRANEIIASLVCEDDEFILGQSSIWHRSAINARLSDFINSSTSIKPKFDLAEVATKLGVSPTDIRSLEEEGILVADGFVISKPRMIQEIQNLARSSMNQHGYVDLTELSSQLGLYSSATLSLIEIALHDVEYISKQEFQLKVEKERLLARLEEATNQAIQIPPELRAWAVDVCKSNPKLQGGSIINMGTEYEPRLMREERGRSIKQRLAEGFAIDEVEARYLDQSTRSSLTRIHSRYCSSALIELISAHALAEVSESGCCSVTEILSAFQTKLNVLAERELMEVIKMVVKESGNELLLLQLDGDSNSSFIFRKSDLDAFRVNGDSSFCKSEEGKLLLQSMFSKKSQQQRLDHQLVNIPSKSKSELESLFSTKLWPEFALYVQGLTKLKRASGQMHNLLTESLLSSELKIQICQVLEALLRFDLQLGPNESIPKEDYETKLKPLVESSNLDEFEKDLKLLSSQQYGLSCLPLHKKQEKDLVSKLKDKWTSSSSTKKQQQQPQHQFDLATWCDLFSLGILHVFKVAILVVPRSPNVSKLWESSKAVVTFPQDFVKWSDDHLLLLPDESAVVSTMVVDDLDAFLSQ